MGEFDLISHIRSRVASGSGVSVGIGDDAAVVRPSPGCELVMSTDNLVIGRHFDDRIAPEDLGHLALAVNLSDLAAMGARPRWCLLTLTLPGEDQVWLDGFLDGFLTLSTMSGCDLVGGNIARGELNIAVTVVGEVAAGGAVLRTCGQSGDRIVVTGTLGDAAAALALDVADDSPLRRRLVHPEPRIKAGRELARVARGMIDLSDGLISDLAHLLGLEAGAEIDCSRLPASDALIEAVPGEAERWRLQLAGGGDYELLAVVPADADPGKLAAAAGVVVTDIGSIDRSGEIVCLDGAGGHFVPGASGWDHFRGGS